MLFSCCQAFYIELIKQIRARFDFSDEFFYFVDVITPAIARECNMSLIVGMLKRFPIITSRLNEDDLMIEFRDHVNIDNSWFGSDITEDSFLVMNPVDYWGVISKQIIRDKPRFPNLSKFVGFIFSLPFSNVPVERVFSQMRLVKTKQRNSLHNTTLASLLQAHEWFKQNGDVSATFPKEMGQAVKAVIANKSIENYPAIAANSS